MPELNLSLLTARLFDHLFIVPFCAGLAIAGLLPVLGNLLRLRGEWLATLGLAHLAAAAGLAGLALAIPPIWSAPVGALAGAGFKHFAGSRSSSAYGLMILVGWSAGLLIAANTSLGGALAHALADGQLYFASGRELAMDLLLALGALPGLRWLTPRLLAARLYPEWAYSTGSSVRYWHLGFDLLTALIIAAATATLGLMATFALILIPPWLAFRFGGDWRRANRIGVAVGLGGYGLAFALALLWDQPFGPILAAVLALACLPLIRTRPASADRS